MRLTGVKPLVWSGIYALFLLSLLTPFGIFTIHFMMIPGLVLFMLLERNAFLLHYAAVLLLFFVITGSFGWPIILISLFFMIPTVVMGTLYKKDTPAHTVITAGIITWLALLVLVILLVSLFGPNVVDVVREFMVESIHTVPEALRQDLPEGLIDQVITMMTQTIPLYMITMAFWFVVITHALGNRLLKALGVEVSRMKPVREWMLPKSLVWYYLVALLLDLFTVKDSQSILVMILWNLIPLLTFAFAVQAISFLFYVVHVKNWNRALPLIGIALAFVMPGIVSLLGVFDVAFDLRRRLR